MRVKRIVGGPKKALMASRTPAFLIEFYLLDKEI